MQEKNDWMVRAKDRWKAENKWRRKGTKQAERMVKALLRRQEALRLFSTHRAREKLGDVKLEVT